jgi:murein L,D-transpeptidase YcbB/YkuD
MKTIVGRKDRPTPIFNDTIEYIEFYPYWSVPHSIATKDILPKLKANAYYATSQNIKIFRGNQIVNPKGIKWHHYSEKNFPFTLRQEPSKNNALGTVKFMFPNKHSVYLHDTPSKGIFYKYTRSESSGCIRVSKPQELAVLLLKDAVSEAKINQIFALGKNRGIRMPYSVPVSIEYLTAFVSEGVLNIRPDIYDYDQPLFNQLLTKTKK